jgi:hypothetical protein
MYASREEPKLGDIVEHASLGRGEVINIEPNGMGGQEWVTVKWTGMHQQIPGVPTTKAPGDIPTSTLMLITRKR